MTTVQCMMINPQCIISKEKSFFLYRGRKMNYTDDWLTPEHYRRCAEIDKLTQSGPDVTIWDATDFANEMREANICGRIISASGPGIIGFYVYLSVPPKIVLLHLAVHPDFQRKGIGTAILNKIKRKLSRGRYKIIIAPCRESLLGAQLFLKSNGFKATKVLHENYLDTDEDAYIFTYASSEGVIEQEVAEIQV